MSKLAMGYAMNKRKKMASGGAVTSELDLYDDDKNVNQTADMIARIMARREAGSTVERADALPADYSNEPDAEDIMSTNSGAADGDMLGNEAEDEDRSDIVSRVMRSRAKKDRMPRPA